MIAYVVLISEVCGYIELTQIYACDFSYLDDRISVSCDIISLFVNMSYHRGIVCVHKGNNNITELRTI